MRYEMRHNRRDTRWDRKQGTRRNTSFRTSLIWSWNFLGGCSEDARRMLGGCLEDARRLPKTLMQEGFSDWVPPDVPIWSGIPMRPLSLLVGLCMMGFSFVQFARWNSSYYYHIHYHHNWKVCWPSLVFFCLWWDVGYSRAILDWIYPKVDLQGLAWWNTHRKVWCNTSTEFY